MSHIDSGTLHEYLDGELKAGRRAEVEDHLADCETCQARLEEAHRAARASSELLAELEPGPAPAPAWDELRRRAESRSSGGSGGTNWLKPGLAWAASIALAFVMGWSASNYLQLTPGMLPTAAERAAPGATPAADREARLEPASSFDELDAGAPAESRQAVGRSVASEEAAGTGAGAADGDATRSPARQRGVETTNEEAFQQKPPTPADAVAGLEASEPEAQNRDPRRTASRDDFRMAPATLPANRQEVAGMAEAETVIEAPSLADEAPSQEIWIDALGRAALGEEQKAALMSALREDVRQRTSFRAAAATLFRAAQPEEARRLLGGPLRTLPDLNLSGLEVGPGAAVPGAIIDLAVVRVVYTDAAGNEITLVQQRPGQGTRVEDEDEDLPILTVSPSGLTAYRWQDSAGYRLVLIGEVSGDSLRALADRVR